MLLYSERSPRTVDSRPSPDVRLWPPPVVRGSNYPASDRRTLGTSEARDRSLDIVLSPPPSPSQSPPSDVRFSPVPAGSPRLPLHTKTSAPRGKIRSPRAPPCAPLATPNESVPRCASAPPHFPPARRCSTAATAHTTGTLRKRCTTADSNNAHSSHGRNVPPASRVTDRRSHPGPGRFLAAPPGGLRGRPTPVGCPQLRHPARSFSSAPFEWPSL